jgi:hypothetical protein
MALPVTSTAIPELNEGDAAVSTAAQVDAPQVIDDLFAEGNNHHRTDATEAEIVLGIRRREDRIHFLEVSKELVDCKGDIEQDLMDVEDIAENNEINLDEERGVRKLGHRELNALLTQFYGKRLPSEIASSKKAKVAKWLELKEMDRSELNQLLPPPRPWDAVWDSASQLALQRFKLEKRMLELSKAVLEKQRTKASTIANILEASPSTLTEYAEALLLGRSTETKTMVKQTLFESNNEE